MKDIAIEMLRNVCLSWVNWGSIMLISSQSSPLVGGSATTPIILPNKYSRNKSGSLQAVQLHRRGWNSTINGLTWRAYLWPASASTTRIANTHCTEDAFRVANHLSRKISRAYRRRKSFFRRTHANFSSQPPSIVDHSRLIVARPNVFLVCKLD